MTAPALRRNLLVVNESVGATHSSIALKQTKYMTTLPLPVRSRPAGLRERRPPR